MKWIRLSVRNARELLFLTAAHTSMPLASASSTMKLPMKPLAPVMSIRSMYISFCRADKYFGFENAKLQ